MTLPDVSIVIPTSFSRRSDINEDRPMIFRCVESIINTNPKSKLEFVVVGSKIENSQQFKDLLADFGYRAEFVYLEIIESEFNFSKNVNLGIQSSQASHVIVLNDDTISLTLNWVTKILTNHYHDVRPKIYGFLLLYPNFTVQHCGVSVTDSSLTHILNGVNLSQLENIPELFESNFEVSAVTGAAMSMDKAIWHEIGGFDEEFPLNFNDIDFCLRARNEGFGTIQCCSIKFMHLESATRKPGASKEEIQFFYGRHTNLVAEDKFRNWLLDLFPEVSHSI